MSDVWFIKKEEKEKKKKKKKPSDTDRWFIIISYFVLKLGQLVLITRIIILL